MSAWQEREEELETQLNKNALWAITYGDLMSYLAIFFLIMFVATATKSVAIQMAFKAVEQQASGQGGSLLEQLGSVQQIAKIEIKETKLRMIFNEPIMFDPGKATLKTSAQPPLRMMAKALLDIPNAVQVEGHTDDRPLLPGAAFKTNWELSSARAFSVLRFLEEQGIPSQRLSAIGYGEHRPLRPNDTAENRQSNRRIEINVTRVED